MKNLNRAPRKNSAGELRPQPEKKASHRPVKTGRNHRPPPGRNPKIPVSPAPAKAAPELLRTSEVPVLGKIDIDNPQNNSALAAKLDAITTSGRPAATLKNDSPLPPAPSVPESKTAEPTALSEQDLLDYDRDRRYQMKLLDHGEVEFHLGSLACDYMQTDRTLLDYVSSVFMSDDSLLAAMASQGDVYWQTCFQEARLIAWAVSDWEPHYARYGAAGVTIPKELPAHWPMPGLAGSLPFDVSEALFQVCNALYYRAGLIQEYAEKHLAAGERAGAIELAEVLVISEAVSDRAGVETELCHNRKSNARSSIQRWCWELRLAALTEWRNVSARTAAAAAA